ncbi:MAG: FAD-binding oxidoreductase [Geminicoccaceae bacterium]
MLETSLYDVRHYDRTVPVGSYWEATAGPDTLGLSPLNADMSAEVAVIGGGYTGLSAAYHLAREHGIQAVVLEAGAIGWGASGRNGGFCGMGGSKLGYGEMAQSYGGDAARRYFNAQKGAVALVRQITQEEQIDVEPTGDAEYYVAHKPSRWIELQSKQAMVQRMFGEKWELLRQPELEERLLRAPEAYGALVVPHYFGLHPMRWVRGLAGAAVRHGAKVYPHSPVTRWEQDGEGHRLVTPGGTVRAGRVLVATNGYTPEGLDGDLAGRVLPALSAIVVTRPLTEAERAAHWSKPALIADTRNLLFYIRLLRDGRLLFGARGGTDASPAAFQERIAWMRRRLGEKFPAWKEVGTDYAWWGLVCLARDFMPHLGWLDDRRSTLAGMAYHGSGVSFGTLFGKAAAALLAGKEPDPPLPAPFLTPPPRFPLPGTRMLALKAAYAGYRFKDEVL